MKLIRIISLVLFVAIIAVPVAFFNTTPDAVSVIDNRKLTELPLTFDGDFARDVKNYVNDRIGFRDEMITSFTVLNDKLFGKMVHPSYSYGEDGYVFGAGLTVCDEFSDYHVVFADMVAAIQNYCEERDVPFLFVFNPAKPAVYQDKIHAGINYNRIWVDRFFAELDKRNIHYLDNTETMRNARADGHMVFNPKYDANHWNDLGAFYGTQAILERLAQMNDQIHINQREEFTVSETLQTSLPVSQFAISEYVPSFGINVPVTSLSDQYIAELDMSSYRGFGYYLNSSDKVKETPKTLVFQGSYMIGFGYKFLINAFEEYIYVHDYQNVINFPYFFNIFQPECVVFEVAEYTFGNVYFDYERMKSIHYNPSLSKMEKSRYSLAEVADRDITVEKGNSLTSITWRTDKVFPYVWATLDTTYDMQKVEGGYQTVLETKRYEAAGGLMEIYVSNP